MIARVGKGYAQADKADADAVADYEVVLDV